MAEPPEIEIVGGSPTPEEEAAIREAILRLWRQEQAEARRATAGGSRWVATARADAGGWGAADLRGTADAWRLGLRLPGLGLVSVRRAGRGDSK